VSSWDHLSPHRYLRDHPSFEAPSQLFIDAVNSRRVPTGPPLLPAQRGRRPRPRAQITSWPLQDIRSLHSNLALFNHPCIAPSICIAHTIAMLSHDYCTIYDPHPTALVYAIHHATLAVAISCKGQITSPSRTQTRPCPARTRPVQTPPILSVCLLCGSRPLCGSLPCCVGRPSVWGGPLWVGPLWVPRLLCLLDST